jgi:hypothetical protein
MLSATAVQKVHGRIRKEIEPFVVRSDTESEADDGKGRLALSGATTATGLRKVPRDTFQLTWP